VLGKGNGKEIVKNIVASFAKSFLAKTFRINCCFSLHYETTQKIVPEIEISPTIFFQGIYFASSGKRI
jgi:hypothetical protein